MPITAATMPAQGPASEPSVPPEQPEENGPPLPDVQQLLAGIPQPAADDPAVAPLIDKVKEVPDNYWAWFALSAELWSAGYPEWQILNHAVVLARDKGDWDAMLEASDEMGVRDAMLPAARLLVDAYLLAPPNAWRKYKNDFYAILMAAAPEPDLPQHLPHDMIAKVSPELADLVYASHFYFNGEGERGDRYTGTLRKAGMPKSALALLEAERAFFIENDPDKAMQLLDRILSHPNGVPDWVIMIAEADQDMMSHNP